MNPILKIDLENLLKNKMLIKLELGCGLKKKKNCISIDKIDSHNVDIVADIEEGFPYFPDNTIDEIYAYHVLEHIENFQFVLNEIIRILKKGGKCFISVPHFSNPYFYSDYTHKRFFGLYSFYYFSDTNNQLERKVPNFYSNIRIKILSQKLIFKSAFKKKRNYLKRILNILINSNSKIQEFYEENLCYLFPCYNLEVVFTPIK